MHIVDVCAFYSPQGGGVRTYVERKLAIMPKLGARVTILAPGKGPSTERIGPDAEIRYIRAPSFPLDRRYRYFDDEAELHRALDMLAPDVVEASSPWSSASMVARWPGQAVRSLILHADPLSAYAYRWFGDMMPRDWIDRIFGSYWRHLRRLDDSFDLVVSANSMLSARLVEGGLSSVCTIPMGVADTVFSPERRDAELRANLLKRCNLPEDALLLLGVGRFSAEKRWPMVIDAVRRAGRYRAVGLVLIGDGPDLRLIHKHRGGDPHICLVPPIRERARLAQILSSADALVHGCEAETFGMIPAEARASGLPLIVPDQGGARDQCVPGGGLLYEATSAHSLSDAILRFAAADKALPETARAGARDTRLIEDHFSELLARYRRAQERPHHAA